MTAEVKGEWERIQLRPLRNKDSDLDWTSSTCPGFGVSSPHGQRPLLQGSVALCVHGRFAAIFSLGSFPVAFGVSKHDCGEVPGLRC